MSQESSSQSAMQKNIMRRIYMVWCARQVVNSFTIKFAALLIAIVEVRQYVSIKHVLGNSPSFLDVPSTIHFAETAFVGTESVVRVFVVASLVIIGLLARDIAKRFISASRYETLATIYS